MASASSTISAISAEQPIVVVGCCLNIHTLIGIMISSLTGEGIQTMYLYTGIYTQLCAHKHNSPLDADNFIIFIIRILLCIFLFSLHSNHFFGRPRRGLLHRWLHRTNYTLRIFIMRKRENRRVYGWISGLGAQTRCTVPAHSQWRFTHSVLADVFLTVKRGVLLETRFCIYVQSPLMRIMCRHCRRQHCCCCWGRPACRRRRRHRRRRCSTNSVRDKNVLTKDWYIDGNCVCATLSARHSVRLPMKL